MSFQIKAFASIAASIINRARAVQSRVTDFTEGSVARTLLESPAIEIEQLYVQFFNGLLEAIPTAVYSSFGFDALLAQTASGLINVTITAQAQAVVVPANTVWQVAGASARYTNPVDVTIPAGNTGAQVRVIAQVAGAAANVPANTAFQMIPAVSGFVSAAAAAAFVGGADAETPDQRKQRFGAYIASLPRGTTAAISYVLTFLAKLYDASGAELESVADFYIDEQWERDNSLPRALVDVYIFNGTTGASGSLIAYTLSLLTGYTDASGNKIPGYKAAGVHFNVYAATLDALNITASAVIAPGYTYSTVVAAAEAAINTYLLGLKIGATAFPQEIAKAAETVPGMVSFAVTVPAAPVTPALGHKVVAGTYTVTQDTTNYGF